MGRPRRTVRRESGRSGAQATAAPRPRPAPRGDAPIPLSWAAAYRWARSVTLHQARTRLESPDTPLIEAAALGHYLSAAAGQTPAAREIADREDGPVEQRLGPAQITRIVFTTSLPIPPAMLRRAAGAPPGAAGAPPGAAGAPPGDPDASVLPYPLPAARSTVLGDPGAAEPADTDAGERPV